MVRKARRGEREETKKVEMLESKIKRMQKEEEERLEEIKGQREQLEANAAELKTNAYILNQAQREQDGVRRVQEAMGNQIRTLLCKIEESEKMVQDMCNVVTTMGHRTVEAVNVARGGQKPTSEKSGCVICMQETAVWAMIPCGHMIACEGCAQDMSRWIGFDKCFICSDTDQTFMRIFSSGIDVFD